MNPRKSYNEKTMQERRFEQSEKLKEAADLMSDKGYEIGSLEDAEEFARKRR